MITPPSSGTSRLYYGDSYLRVFDAQVLEVRLHDGGHAVILDRTAFFPTSGGQPHDRGTLDGADVLDVVDGEEAIVHVVTRPVAGTVRGEIDWPRRFDHMQQHTGQHVLSQAALQAAGAQTLSVHFGTELCTVDLNCADLTVEMAVKTEDLANAVVFEDRPVIVRMVDEAALQELRLRRPAKTRGLIRVIEVEGFDRSACGGTHVRRTGEIGLIKLRGWERYKGGVRVAFLCGWRALRDYRWKNAMLSDLAGALTVKDREVAEAVARLAAQFKERERTAAELRDRLLDREAHEYLQAAPGDPKIIAGVLDRPADEVSALAGKIIAAAPAAVAFGAAGGRVIVARSPGVPVDAAAVLARALERHGGRGGGRPEFAQGAVPAGVVRAAVEDARAELVRAMQTTDA